MAKYRRKKGKDDKWHWCENCSRWPTANYEEITTFNIPTNLDWECRQKENAGECERHMVTPPKK